MPDCRLCPRKCGADRAAGQLGYCRQSGTLRIARAAPHHWEEPVISGSSGSGTVVSGKVAVVNNPKATQVLNLRQSPSLNAKVLAYYRNGAKVTILQDSGSWYKVQTEDGKLGYMMKQYLRVTDETTQVKPFTATTMNVNGGKIVNMRAGASLKASILRTVPVGTKVTVKEHTTDWCKVEVDGQEGYISTWFLKW